MDNRQIIGLSIRMIREIQGSHPYESGNPFILHPGPPFKGAGIVVPAINEHIPEIIKSAHKKIYIHRVTGSKDIPPFDFINVELLKNENDSRQFFVGWFFYMPIDKITQILAIVQEEFNLLKLEEKK